MRKFVSYFESCPGISATVTDNLAKRPVFTKPLSIIRPNKVKSGNFHTQKEKANKTNPTRLNQLHWLKPEH